MSLRQWFVSATVLVAAAQLALVAGGGAALAGEASHRALVAGLSTSNPTSSCVTDPGDAPHLNETPSAGITLRATVSDLDGNSLRASFDFRQAGSHHPLATSVSSFPLRSGDVASTQILPPTPLTDGVTYQWSVRVRELDATGVPTGAPADSPTCFLVQDGTPPVAPVVTSADYPPGQFAGGVGKAGVFTFTPGDPTDTSLTGYSYQLTGSTPVNVAATGTDRTASVTLTPHLDGPLTLTVRALDAAGNRSPQVLYDFLVIRADGPVAHWKLDEGSGTTVTGTVDSNPTATGPQATLSPTGVSWIGDGKVGAALHFDGASGSVEATGTAVATDRNFTVAAWVRLDSRAAAGAAVSQDGASRSGFALRYDPGTDRWQFALPEADADGARVDAASSATSPELDVWTHLAGVYDIATGQVSLYVNGALAGTAAHPAGWDAAGPLRIGRATASGAGAEFWNGDVDEVRVYDRALSGTDLVAIVNADNASTPAGVWTFDDAAGTTAADSSGQGHPATLEPGASFTPDGHTGGGLALDGVTGAAATAGPVIRTDQSFTVTAWVKLSRDDVPATVLSQDGTNTAGFTLQFVPSVPGIVGDWVFSMAPVDAPNSPAVSPAPVSAFEPVGSWVFVAAVYEASTNQLEVVVLDSFGFGINFGTRQTPWNATGPLRIGADLTVDSAGPAFGNNFPGTVDDVRVYQAALTTDQLQQLTQ